MKKSDVFSQEELEAIEETKQSYQERQQKQDEFLETLSKQEEAQVVETPVELAEGMTTTVRVKMTGELEETIAEMERMGDRLESNESMKELPEIADRACQILADSVTESAYDKETFYKAYQELGSEAIGRMLRRVFEAVEKEVNRQQGEADGFRGV